MVDYLVDIFNILQVLFLKVVFAVASKMIFCYQYVEMVINYFFFAYFILSTFFPILIKYCINMFILWIIHGSINCICYFRYYFLVGWIVITNFVCNEIKYGCQQCKIQKYICWDQHSLLFLLMHFFIQVATYGSSYHLIPSFNPINQYGF